MGEAVVPSRKSAVLSGRRTSVAGLCVVAALVGPVTPAHAVTPATAIVATTTVASSHLSIGNQVFEANVGGLRAYIDSIKDTQPQLYAQLAPDVQHLESRQHAALAVLFGGLAVGTASTIYAFASRNSCPEPALSDPNFAADSAAWGTCNQNNDARSATFLVVGLAAAAAGAFGAFAIAPVRSDILEVTNKHNRLSPTPLRLDLGYDPTHQLAFAGAALTF